MDLACTVEISKFQNKRDMKRLESLIKSLAGMLVSAFGGDASRFLEQIKNQDDEADPLDDDNVW